MQTSFRARWNFPVCRTGATTIHRTAIFIERQFIKTTINRNE